MLKQIKKYGNTHVVIITSDDMKFYNLKEDEVVDLDILKVKIKIMKGGLEK